MERGRSKEKKKGGGAHSVVDKQPIQKPSIRICHSRFLFILFRDKFFLLERIKKI